MVDFLGSSEFWGSFNVWQSKNPTINKWCFHPAKPAVHPALFRWWGSLEVSNCKDQFSPTLEITGSSVHPPQSYLVDRSQGPPYLRQTFQDRHFLPKTAMQSMSVPGRKNSQWHQTQGEISLQVRSLIFSFQKNTPGKVCVHKTKCNRTWWHLKILPTIITEMCIIVGGSTMDGWSRGPLS